MGGFLRFLFAFIVPIIFFQSPSFAVDLNHDWRDPTAPTNSCPNTGSIGLRHLPYCLEDLDYYFPQHPEPYWHTRWGNRQYQEYSPYVDPKKLYFTKLTKADSSVSSSYSNDLFIVDDDDLNVAPAIVPYPSDVTWVAPTPTSDGYVASYQLSAVSLYRKLHFSDELDNYANVLGPLGPPPGDWPHVSFDQGGRKAVILIHGWNPNSNPNSYRGSEFEKLVGSLRTALAGSDWQLVLYHWEADADTGELFLDRNLELLAVNGTQAAEIGHQHGQHLGELLATTAPNLEKVHFIAHSAGSWVARAATRYLLEYRPYVKVQVTLLDPFMPQQSPTWLTRLTAISVLGTAKMQEINFFNNASQDNLPLLENYFAYEVKNGVVIPPITGTEESFHWRSSDITERVDWIDPAICLVPGNVAGSTCAVLSNEEPYYQGHFGPIDFYADTVLDTTILPPGLTVLPASDHPGERLPGLKNFGPRSLGWRKSMFYREKIEQGDRDSVPPQAQPTITSVSPSSLPGQPLPERQTIVINGSGFSKASQLNLYVGTVQYLNRIPTYVSPTELQYSIAVDNVTANWTVKVLNETLESNTASFSVTATPDTGAPSVAIASPTSNFFYTTSASSILLGGTAADDVGLASLRWFNHRGGSGSFAVSTTWSTPSIPLSPGDNVISIFAADAAGNEGSDTIVITYDSSAPSTFPPAPVLQDISVVLGSYTVTWSAVSGASYVLEEDVTGAFANPVRFSLTSNSLAFTGKQSGTYYYRVFAINASGQGPASSVKAAVVAYNQGPGPIYATSPTDDSTNQPLSVTLSWSASHPGGEGLRFNVYVVPADTDIFYPNNLVARGLTGTSFAVSNLPYNNRVSWGVEAIDDTGDVRFSRMFHFTTVADTSPPTGSITINNGAATTDTYSVTLFPSASDIGSGAQYMRFSNDGINWSYWHYLAPQFPWNLVDYQYGGSYGLTTYTVYAQYRDSQGNVSPVYSDTIDKVAGKPGHIILNGKYYQTIQDAINVASPGDTVYLTEGVYTVNGGPSALRPHDPNRVVGIVLRPGVTLKGAGANKTTINFQNSFFGLVDGDNAVVEGMDIVNPSTFGSRSTVLLESSSSKILNCKIRGGYYGVYVGYSPQRPASNTEISNNLVINNSAGVWITPDASNVSVLNNTIAYNSPSSGILTYVTSTNITNNIVAFNGYQIGNAAATPPTIRYNDAFPTSGSSGYGGIPNQTGINGNISADPLFSNSTGGDYTLLGSSPAINAGTNVGIPFAGAAPDMGVYEYNGTGTLAVISNRPDAEFTIIGPQATYSGAGTNWSVANAPIGVYAIVFSPIENFYSPAFQAVSLYSGQNLVFDGTYSQDTIPPTGKLEINFGEYATADALVSLKFDLSDVVGGLGAGSQMKFSNDGVLWTSPELYSALKSDWDLSTFGGNGNSGTKTVYAMVSDALGNWATLTDTIQYVPNRIVRNVPDQYSTVQAAVDAAQPGDVVFVAPGNYGQDIVLKDGITLQGAGPEKTIFSGLTTITAAANTKIDGFGGYLYVIAGSGPVIVSNNVFRASLALDIGTGVTAYVRNNIFDQGPLRIVGYTGFTNVTVENNTFVNGGDGAVHVINASPGTAVHIKNNIFAFNNIAVLEDISGDLGHRHIFSSFNMYWGNVKGNFGELDTYYQSANNYKQIEAGDVNADPLFVDYPNGNVRLQPGSPAVNSGNPEAIYNDLDGSRNDRGFSGGGMAAPLPTTPTIAAEPENQSVLAGASITFSVGVLGTAPFTYQWQKNGSNIISANGPSLTINNVSNADAGGYSVIVSNELGSTTSRIAYLTVGTVLADLEAPVLTITSPANGAILNAASVTVTGSASDAGRGDNGIAQVWVNGLPAAGGLVTGGNTATWSLSVPLSAGLNTITVVTVDSSPNRNSTASTINVTYDAPPPPPVCPSDSDCDGMSDVWELAHGTNPLVNDAGGDLDGDGFSNGQEHAAGSDPGSNASAPEGANGVAYVLFRDHFDDLQYDDRWQPGAIDPDTIYSLNESGTLLQGTMQRPASGCRRGQLYSFATVDFENAVYRARLRMNGGGALIYGLMQGLDPNNQIEVRVQETTPYLRILSWQQAALTDAPAMAPADYRNQDLNVRIVKTGTLYQIFVNHVLQGALPNTGISHIGLRPFLTLESCAGDGMNADSQFDLVEVLIDRDGDGLADLHEDKNKNGVTDAGESDPLNDDTDGDTVPDGFDNCLLVPNANPRDTNGDGYGNRCDADLDNSGFVNAADLAIFKSRYGTADPDADLDGNGFVNAADLAIFKSLFGKAPGPSGVAP